MHAAANARLESLFFDLDFLRADRQRGGPVISRLVRYDNAIRPRLDIANRNLCGADSCAGRILDAPRNRSADLCECNGGGKK